MTARPQDRPHRARGPRRAIALIGATALIFGVTSMDDRDGCDPTRSGRRRNTRYRASPLVDIGPTAPDREIPFELVLAFPGSDAMQAYALSVGDPSSRRLSPVPGCRRDRRTVRAGGGGPRARQGLGRRPRHFHPRDISAADRHVGGRPGRHDRVALRRGAPRLCRCLRTDLSRADGTPRLPNELDGLVAAIEGLDARPSERPAFSNLILAGPQNGMTPPSSTARTSSRACGHSTFMARARRSQSSRSTRSTRPMSSCSTRSPGPLARRS